MPRKAPEKPWPCIAHDCVIARRTGMGVTGVCKCLRFVDYKTKDGREKIGRAINALRWYQQRVAELEEENTWLTFFVQEADFGPGGGDESERITEKFVRKYERLPPKGWNFNSEGEEMTQEDLERILGDEE